MDKFLIFKNIFDREEFCPPSDDVMTWEESQKDTVVALFLIHGGNEFYSQLSDEGHITDDCHTNLEIMLKSTADENRLLAYMKCLKYNAIAASSIYCVLEDSLQDAVDDFFGDVGDGNIIRFRNYV